MMLRSFSIVLAFVLALGALVPSTLADAPAKIASPVALTGEAIFDRAVDLLAKDPLTAKAQFEKAAALYESTLSGPLAQNARAQTLYNLGASRQLAGDTGRALLAFRRADLLAPATPGLAERLTAARSAARGDAAPASSSNSEPSLADLAKAWTLSLPRLWLWRIAIVGWVSIWTLALLRAFLPLSALRPPISLIAIALATCLAPSALLGVMWNRDHQAAAQAVLLSDTIARSEPDDLIGQPAAAPFKAGTELLILSERTGGNGQNWLLVRPLDAPPVADESPMWVPASSVGRIVDR